MFTSLHLMYLRRCVDQLLLVNDNSQLHFILSSNPIKSNEEKSFTLLRKEKGREKQGEKTLATTINIRSRLAGHGKNELTCLFEASILSSCANPTLVFRSCFSYSVVDDEEEICQVQTILRMINPPKNRSLSCLHETKCVS